MAAIASAMKRGRGDDAQMPRPPKKPKVVKCVVHNQAELHAISWIFVDTPEFKRLHNLRQLGVAYHVFPGATNTRFPHCIGAAYLARFMMLNFRKEQPELYISDKEVRCVELAALAHDLGHGPMSHLYDGPFLTEARRRWPDQVPEWEHEVGSIHMFRKIVERPAVSQALAEEGIGEEELHMICEMILGNEKHCPEGWVWKGPPKGREFLYEIVSNQRNGVDVDKLDYFQRDCHYLGIGHALDCSRLLSMARVVQNSCGEMVVGFPTKEVWNVAEVFQTRYSLHVRAYQHRVVRAIGFMMVEALISASPHLKLGPRSLPLHKACEDPETWQKVDDSIVRQIANSFDPELSTARQILDRIDVRDHYKAVGETLVPPGVHLNAKNARELEEHIATHVPDSAPDAETAKANIIIDIYSIGYGGVGTSHPLSTVPFFEYGDDGVPVYRTLSKRRQESTMPKWQSQQYVRAYCRDPVHIPVLQCAFDKWVRITYGVDWQKAQQYS
jgi:deoxynucleoside triphosphate triphosphohydrolase SAMHD1